MKLDINRGMYVPDYEGDKSKFEIFNLFNSILKFRQMPRIHYNFLRSYYY